MKKIFIWETELERFVVFAEDVEEARAKILESFKHNTSKSALAIIAVFLKTSQPSIVNSSLVTIPL